MKNLFMYLFVSIIGIFTFLRILSRAIEDGFKGWL